MPFSFEGLTKRGIRLSKHSSYCIGGEADYFACPSSLAELLFLIDYSQKFSLPYTLFGLGANILFPDNPVKGHLFISMKNLLDMKLDGRKISFTAGIPLSFLAICGIITGRQDLSFTHLLPGTIGGGIIMNARYGEKEVSQIVSSITYADLDEKSLSIHSISSSDCAFGYKKSLFQGKNWVILGADIEIPEYLSNTPHIIKNIFEKMKRKALLFSDLKNYYTFFHSVTSAIKGIEKNPLIKEIEIYRTGKKHFKYPSCGSVFKNNRALGAPAGYIIDRLGLKGFSHGGAMVSPHHGNIIINYKKARAADVIYLIDYISDQIYKNHGIMPEKEVIILQ